jgi:hypothetical protein
VSKIGDQSILAAIVVGNYQKKKQKVGLLLKKNGDDVIELPQRFS